MVFERSRSHAVLALFFASGAVGLIYQVVWVRWFIHVFGATVLAVSTVLAAFMGGLAVGGLWGGRAVGRLKRPLRAYGILEIGLAVASALVPLVLRGLDPIFASVYPSLSESFATLSGVRFLASLIVLLPPTFLMGATLPFLVGHAERERSGGRSRVAQLYAVNTFGAVAGTALASFVLLPGVGLTRTWLVGIGVNLVVGIAALALDRARRPAAAGVAASGSAATERTDENASASAEENAPDVSGGEASPPSDDPGFPRPLVLLTAGVLGLAALAFEVIWTRTLALALGTTTYAFAIVLTVFLLGIAGGSAWAGRILRGPPARARAVFAAAPALVGFLALALLPVFDRLPALFISLSARGAGSWGEGLLFRFLLAGLPMLPPTFLSGAAFPLAVGLARRRSGVGRAVGDVYAANTFGAILGSWAAGFLLIPTVGLRTGVLIGAGLQIAATCLLLASRPSARSRSIAVGVALLGVATALFLPDWDRSALTRGGFAVAIDLRRYGLTELAVDRQELVFLKEGITSTITVRRRGDQLTMQMNGVTEASNTGDVGTQVFVGGFGGLLHENPEDVLVIGLGSGITAAAAARHPATKSVECVEISEAVVEASHWFDEANGNLIEDPRVKMIVGDGRNHLRLSGRRYDVIVSQPSNIWNSGIGSLMSAEFYALAADHLKPGGVLVSWIQGYAISPDALRSVMAAVRAHFPRASLWMAGWGDLVIVAGDDDLSFDAERLLERGRDAELGRMFHEMEAPDILSLFSKNVMAGSAYDRFVGDFPPNTDDDLYLEFEAPKLLYRETIPELFAALDAASGGLEEMVTAAPPGLLEELTRARRGRIRENQARIAFREQRGEEGLRRIEEAWALHPSAPSISTLLASALNGRGETRSRRGETAEAAADFLRAADIDRATGAPFSNLADLYRDAAQRTTALEASDEALRREPRRPEFLAQRAELHAGMRQFEEAERWADEALAIDSRLAEAWSALGAARAGLGRAAAADSAFAEAVRLAPDDEELAQRRRRLASEATR